NYHKKLLFNIFFILLIQYIWFLKSGNYIRIAATLQLRSILKRKNNIMDKVMNKRVTFSKLSDDIYEYDKETTYGCCSRFKDFLLNGRGNRQSQDSDFNIVKFSQEDNIEV
ncbi:hypothetical protein SLOPH_828, partial [Spraguea lophii 42_110]